MSATVMALGFGWASPAVAAEVVWTATPDPELARAAAHQAGALGPPLDLTAFRATGSAWSADDDDALRDLEAALVEARTYEDDLDGELVILRDLERPLARVTALRDAHDRQALTDALLYQGFAADRYFADDLATAPDAAPYRAEVSGTIVPRAWLDAAALEPGVDASPYQIAEAPQRIAYDAARARLDAVLPASVTPVDFPPGAALVIDGRLTPLGPSGNAKVRPGRHRVHLEAATTTGAPVILARWDLSLAPGVDAPLVPPVGETVWQRFLADPGSVPPGIAAWIAARGGEIWLLGPDGVGAAITAAGARPVAVDRGPTPETRATSGAGGPLREGFGASAGLTGGWLSSGDFYAQDPSVPRSRATVNAATLGGWLDAALALGPGHLGAGLDLAVPLGPNHAALTGDRAVRARPVPYLAAGLGPVEVAAGFLFPYHPAVGGHLALPLGDRGPRGILRIGGWAGIPVTTTRPDGTRWQGLPVFTASTGLGIAL